MKKYDHMLLKMLVPFTVLYTGAIYIVANELSVCAVLRYLEGYVCFNLVAKVS